ncbi:uncharacterized protein LOC115725034 [Cannabis sativa]|uniref:Uncharacterized protein n=1 Tax=Cannabis sativa TaxID=3483 RepID=A0A7J6FYS5_CANSA|nr:uncharacterized protein LOC115725034 [Cannabis sativa]KAF4375876.1 hypothetical protein G4B88_002223 [Cannabis sativa]
MSLSLIQAYSSAEEEEEEAQNGLTHQKQDLRYNSSSDDDNDDDHNLNDVDEDDESAAINRSIRDRSLFDLPQPSVSGLPSAFDAFSEVAGPPQFLNNSVEEFGVAKEVDHQQYVRHGRRRNRRDKKDLPAGVVVEAKPQLVGIHERVRSDIEGKQPPPTVPGTTEGGKRVATAANPNAEDAAELLRMCLQCGIPKTYSSARGMVCPVCGDRPPAEPGTETKKKVNMVKDKEKNKRMKGQSSHATWKSETEMHLRQQFD